MSNKSITISAKSLIIIISVAAVLIVAAVSTVLLLGGKTQPAAAPVSQTETAGLDIDPNAGVWNGLQPEDKVGPTQAGIKIPGYPSITIPKDKSTVSVALLNPEGNPCYFKFEIVLNDSKETLYTSKLVPPGQAITQIKLSKPLTEGKHPAIIKISTISLADGSAMNGANVETVLIAK